MLNIQLFLIVAHIVKKKCIDDAATCEKGRGSPLKTYLYSVKMIDF